MLAVYSNVNQTNWDLYLPLVLFAYRTSQHATTLYSSFELVYNRKPRLPCDLDTFDRFEPSKFMDDINYGWVEAKRQIIEQAAINKKKYESKYQAEPVEYRVGEEVRLRQPQTQVGLKKKLRNDFWSQPKEITKLISPQNIEINNRYK